MTGAGRGERRFAPHWRFTLLLPVAYNPTDSISPGGAVEGAKFLGVEERLASHFGGFTKLAAPGQPVLEGQWRDPASGVVYVDLHRRYEIVCARRQAHAAFMLALHEELLGLFRQEEIFLTREAIGLAVARDGA